MNLRPLMILALVAGVPMGAMAAESHATHDPGSEASKALMAVNEKMMTDMMAPMSGNPDRDFVVMMIPHHQGAIEMARVQLQFGTDPGIRKLAEAVIAAQKTEIAEMEAWLAAHPQ